MELIALNCNHCGSKLKVAETAKFVTCKHCDTQLAIHHNDGASFTELAEAASRVEESAKQIEEHAEVMSDQTDVLVLQNDLERLDREWRVERDSMMIKGKNGHEHEPSRTQAFALYVLAPGFACFGVIVYSQTDSLASLFGCVLGAGFFLLGMSTMGKAKAFEAAKARYAEARAELEAQLATASASRKVKKRKVKCRAAD